jgi:hypothetical protein
MKVSLVSMLLYVKGHNKGQDMTKLNSLESLSAVEETNISEDVADVGKQEEPKSKPKTKAKAKPKDKKAESTVKITEKTEKSVTIKVEPKQKPPTAPVSMPVDRPQDLRLRVTRFVADFIRSMKISISFMVPTRDQERIQTGEMKILVRKDVGATVFELYSAEGLDRVGCCYIGVPQRDPTLNNIGEPDFSDGRSKRLVFVNKAPSGAILTNSHGIFVSDLARQADLEIGNHVRELLARTFPEKGKSLNKLQRQAYNLASVDDSNFGIRWIKPSKSEDLFGFDAEAEGVKGVDHDKVDFFKAYGHASILRTPGGVFVRWNPMESGNGDDGFKPSPAPFGVMNAIASKEVLDVISQNQDLVL